MARTRVDTIIVTAPLVMVMILGPAIGPAQGQQPATPSAFDLTDTNRDGRITPEEYRARMLEVFFLLDRNKDGADARMNDYTAADQNRDGALTRNETAGK